MKKLRVELNDNEDMEYEIHESKIDRLLKDAIVFEEDGYLRLFDKNNWTTADVIQLLDALQGTEA